MLAQGWPDIVQPTTQNSFYWQKNGVGPTLARCCSTNQIQILYQRISLCWSNVGLCCKFNTIKKVSLSKCHLAHVDVGPTLNCPYVVYPTPTISQRYNGLPTLVQRSHAIWVLICVCNYNW